MKRFGLLTLLIFPLFLGGCKNSNTIIQPNEQVALYENYEGVVYYAGVGPEESGEPTVNEGTLVLGGNYEDHSDHLFAEAGIWENRLENIVGPESEEFRIICEVEELDGAAGNHYYNIKRIKSLTINNPELYESELTIAGIGPDESFHPTVEEGTLVATASFEDHSDHIFFPAGTWENLFLNDYDALPGNVINFKGYVRMIDAGAGNHYYQVYSVDDLKVKSYPDEDKISQLLEIYNFCETDSDCTNFYPNCPFGCNAPINIKFSTVASRIIENYQNQLIEHSEMQCIYDCASIGKPKCENYKCVSEEIFKCSEAEKEAEVCNLDYRPVCGDDGITYGNACAACASKQVDTYREGEC